MKITFISILFSLISLSAFSNTTGNNQKIADEKFESLVIDNDFLNGFKITEEEYKRFVYLRDNTHSGLIGQKHPLYLLGANAKTEAEKRRFAKMIAIMEFESWEKTQKFNHLIQEESIKVYGLGKVVDLNQKINFKTPLVKDSKKMSLVTYLYVHPDCIEDCSKAVKDEISNIYKGDTKNLQIIFPKSTSNYSMKVWAAKSMIPVQLNKSGSILLRERIEGDHEVDKFPVIHTELY